MTSVFAARPRLWGASHSGSSMRRRAAVGSLFACLPQLAQGDNTGTDGAAVPTDFAVKRASEVQEDSGLRDVSADICWTGEFTKDHCCRGDPSTHPDCWDGVYSFGECCPNADCWDDGVFTFDHCCGERWGPRGNSACWSGTYTYSHCCLANQTAISWYEVMAERVDTAQFYAMDDFYTDAQYGDDFGYYSTGHVLAPGLSKDDPGLNETQQFAHFTTYPMVLSPHFGRVFCRLLFVMWIQLEERAPFRVVEMGAGSGQLSNDVQQCVRLNELGIAPPVWRRWASAFEYIIMERSPALARRQRERGLRVVAGDAQSTASCKPVLAAMAASTACAGQAGEESPECVPGDRGTAEAGASVVLSNELLDAFAPVKLRLSLYGKPNLTSCRAFQEVSLVHTISEKDLLSHLEVLGHSEQSRLAMLQSLSEYTESIFCAMANTTIGMEAMKRVPSNTSCLVLVFALGELINHVDLGVPAASHNMRLRIRKDAMLWSRVVEVVARLTGELFDSVAIPKDVYRQLRHQLKNAPDVEVSFLWATRTYHMPVALRQSRCDELQWWFVAHESRIKRLANFYASLGYPALHLVVRPGERNFIDLVDCLLGPTGGFKLSIDYGATFEGLAHSLSIDPKNDGIFVPPIPHELMGNLPNCHEFWPRCAGRIDWTTFVDFTNLAAAAENLGWRTIFYGAQSQLEHTSRLNLSANGVKYSVPGYSVLERTWASRHVASWYGRENLGVDVEAGTWLQRWTSFKALLMEKPPVPSVVRSQTLRRPVLFPSWHLDTQLIDSCWRFDPTIVPLADWIPRVGQGDARGALKGLTEEINDGLGRDYAMGYEEAQLSVRMVDWLVATGGCDDLRPASAAQTLASRGLWQLLRSRLLRKWGEIWGAEAVTRIALSLFERLADPESAEAASSPAACAGTQTYFTLCEDPGGGSMMSLRGFAARK
eukprot:TRINITY_DN1459_c0_g2_i2.p1 TRINITY_DN1459_c0_g2~~TRINITY_DN1459_c0_g2_i2.p1  ORF type:complete len:939 (-),score=143.41 TRINITY_DN1459_c0_g2_i2:146-2962(-)